MRKEVAEKAWEDYKAMKEELSSLAAGIGFRGFHVLVDLVDGQGYVFLHIECLEPGILKGYVLDQDLETSRTRYMTTYLDVSDIRSIQFEDLTAEDPRKEEVPRLEEKDGPLPDPPPVFEG